MFSNIISNSIIHNNRRAILISIKVIELKKNNTHYVKIEFRDIRIGIENDRIEYIKSESKQR